MIIHGLIAENLLKYRHLELSDLPEQGLIAVGGPNESGKSSIGESICFALFGRSFAVGPGDLEKLIRWSESSCSVTLEFSVAGGTRYQVHRFLDRDGHHSARLCLAGEPDNPVARGAEAVSGALYAILGYNFDVFVDSFYLAQREITAPHPHSRAVKIMAGIAPLERCRAEFKQESVRDREIIETSGRQIEEVDAKLRAVEFDPQRLAETEGALSRAVGLVAGARRCRESLNSVAADYRERRSGLRAAQRGRATATALRLLSLLLAVAAFGLWDLLTRAPESSVGRWVARLLSGNIGGWQEGHVVWLLYGGAGFGTLLILFWIRAAYLGRRIHLLHEADRQLREQLKPLDEMESTLAGGSREESGESGGEQPNGRLGADVRQAVLERAGAGTAEVDEVFDLVGRENRWLDRALERLRLRIGELEAEIVQQHEIRDEYNRLRGEKSALERQVEEHRHLIRLRELADGLLLGAARHRSHRFNYNLRGLVGQTLPLFTEGRYEHLQIDENLSVQAFSSDKRGFMDLAEISSGTQRQIMLALRLALAQELINRAVKSRQFLFLDEPFAFFDDERARSSLAVLPRLSDDITQIWVIAQKFPEDVRFERRIQCDREGDSCVSRG